MYAALVVGATSSVAPPTTTPHKYEDCINLNNKTMYAALVVNATASIILLATTPHKDEDGC